MQGISESVARRLNHYNVKIAHKPHSALRANLVHVKDPIPTLQRRKVIYQIQCSGCDKAYTGQAGCLLGTRLKEHRGSVKRHDRNSCLALHCMDTGYTFNWQDTRILGYANSQRTREAIGRTQRKSVYAIRPMLQANASTTLINIPPLSPTLSTSLNNLPPPPLHRH